MPTCALHRVHHPSVARVFPLVIDGEEILICGTGLDNLAICVDYMRGGGAAPEARVGKETWDLAQRVLAAKKTTGL